MLFNIINGFPYNIMTSGFIFTVLVVLSLGFIIALSGLELIFIS